MKVRNGWDDWLGQIKVDAEMNVRMNVMGKSQCCNIGE